MEGTIGVQLSLGFAFYVLGLLIGPAFTRIQHTNHGATLAEVRVRADESVTGIRTWFAQRREQRPVTTSMDPKDKLVLGIFVGIIVVVAYGRYHTAALVAMIALASSVTIIATIALVRLSRAGVITDHRGVGFALTSAYLVTAVGVINVVLLSDPPAGGELLRAFLDGSEQVPGGGLTSFLFTAYQVLGAISCIAVGLISTAFSFALLSALSVYTGAWGQWIHKVTYALCAFSWSWASAIGALLFTILSLLLSSGLAFTWITRS